jgi:hypothetical protein
MGRGRRDGSRLPARRRARPFFGTLRVRQRHVARARSVRNPGGGRFVLRRRGEHRPRWVHVSQLRKRRRARCRFRLMHCFRWGWPSGEGAGGARPLCRARSRSDRERAGGLRTAGRGLPARNAAGRHVPSYAGAGSKPGGQSLYPIATLSPRNAAHATSPRGLGPHATNVRRGDRPLPADNDDQGHLRPPCRRRRMDRDRPRHRRGPGVSGAVPPPRPAARALRAHRRPDSCSANPRNPHDPRRGPSSTACRSNWGCREWSSAQFRGQCGYRERRRHASRTPP